MSIDWECGKTIDSKPASLAVWSFQPVNKNNNGLTLDLGMHTVENKGTITFSIFCPFWMVNKTGLNICYRVSSINKLVFFFQFV